MAYWAVAQLEAHRERVAEHFLKQFGFEVYLPRVHRFLMRLAPPHRVPDAVLRGLLLSVQSRWAKALGTVGQLRSAIASCRVC
jgi:hypothetical protein